MKSSKSVDFSLVGIETKQFAIIEENLKSDDKIRFGINFNFSIDPDKAMVAVFPTFHFECEGNIFLIVEAGCHFKIDEVAWDEMRGDGSITIPKGFIHHLAVITVGTCRGILHSKTENTNFNGFFIPPVNVTEIITDNQTFNLSE